MKLHEENFKLKEENMVLELFASWFIRLKLPMETPKMELNSFQLAGNSFQLVWQ